MDRFNFDLEDTDVLAERVGPEHLIRPRGELAPEGNGIIGILVSLIEPETIETDYIQTNDLWL